MTAFTRRVLAISVLIFFALVAIVFFMTRDDLPAAIRDSLDDADQYELLSIFPYRSEKPGDFHGFYVLGKTIVTDAETRKKLTEALRAGVRESDGSVAACFNPRHAIRVTKGGRTVDLLICFECLQIYVYLNDEKTSTLLTTSAPQTTFDRVLSDAGIPLAPQEH